MTFLRVTDTDPEHKLYVMTSTIKRFTIRLTKTFSFNEFIIMSHNVLVPCIYGIL